MTDTDVRKLVFANEYDAQAGVYQRAGISKENYVSSRMRDEGLADLEPLTANDLDTLRLEAEYREHAEMFARDGVTMAQYVASRRIDKGLATLRPSNEAQPDPIGI